MVGESSGISYIVGLMAASFVGCAFATSVCGQAAAEYAARSATTATDVAKSVHFGVCDLNSNVLACVRHYYPVPFFFTVLLFCVVFLKLLFPKRKV